MYVCIEQETLHKIYNFPNTDIQTILIPFPIHIPISNFRLSFLSSSSFFFKQMLKCFLSQVAFFFSSLEGKKNNDLISLHPPLALLARETFASKRNESPVYMCTSTRETCVYTYTYIWEYISYTYYIYIYIYIYVCIGECIKK